MSDIGERMKKNYEDRSRIKLLRKTPVIIRLDGKSFHTVTKNAKKPFDRGFLNCMYNTSLYLLRYVQGAKCVYTQSDEISLLLTDFDNIETEAWFDYNLQKIVSISAAMASVKFNNELQYVSHLRDNVALFDSRAFNVPREEVCNYFIWRQKDCIRNSIQMLGRSYFTQQELLNVSCHNIKEMLLSINVDWDNFEDCLKYGVFMNKNEFGTWNSCSSEFTENRLMVEKYV